MPGTKHAPGKRRRAPRSAKTVLAQVVDRAGNLEAPLIDAADLVHALLVMGYGMMAEHHDHGRPIVAVAGAAFERLDAVRDAWREILQAAGGRRAARWE
jgi:hypothetical protein